jgi:hypothetical protein
MRSRTSIKMQTFSVDRRSWTAEGILQALDELGLQDVIHLRLIVD